MVPKVFEPLKLKCSLLSQLLPIGKGLEEEKCRVDFRPVRIL